MAAGWTLRPPKPHHPVVKVRSFSTSSPGDHEQRPLGVLTAARWASFSSSPTGAFGCSCGRIFRWIYTCLMTAVYADAQKCSEQFLVAEGMKILSKTG